MSLPFPPRPSVFLGLVGILALLFLLCLTILISAESPPVEVEKEAEPGSTTSGEDIEYTATFSNSSGADVGLLIISDSLPTDFVFLAMLAGSDIVDDPTGTTGTIVWTGPYTVAAHGSLDLIYKVRADAPANLAPYLNQVQARLSTGEIISDSAGIVILGAQLDGTKEANASQVYRDEPVDYTVVLANSGNLTATLEAITDTLPAGFAFSQMISGPLPPPSVDGSVLQWAGPLTVPLGGELRFTYRVTASHESSQDLANQVVVRYDGTVAGPFAAEVDVLDRTTYLYIPTVFKDFYIEPPPSETLLAFDSYQTDNFEIFVIGADGTGQQNVSNSSGGDLDPTWSGLGTKLAWVHYYDGRGDILSAKIDGSELVNLTNHAKDDRSPDWSPDGSQIVFSSYRDDKWEVYVMDADGSDQTRLTDRLCQSHDPIWSPDGTRIAFLCGLDSAAEVFVMDADGSNEVRLTDDDYEATALNWSPDNVHIVFVLKEPKADSELYKVNANSGVLTRLTDNDSYEFAPTWSPDGSRIAFSTNRTGNYEIFTMDPNGSDLVNLTQATGADYVPAWSWDGTLISFIATRDGNKELYIMNADGSNQRRLTNTAEDEADHAWQPMIP
jgi:uncharacterized repeat protein (TIGR01451 family)